MPTNLPWGTHAPGLGRVHPVQLYAAVVALVLFAMLLRMLQHRLRPGVVAEVALVLGGVAAFQLDMLMQPTASGSAWLDPGQWIALGAMVVGMWMLLFLKELV